MMWQVLFLQDSRGEGGEIKASDVHLTRTGRGIFALVCCCLLFPLSASPWILPPSRATFRHLTTTDGLTQDSVYNILQDHQGFIWLATENGLNRFDGIEVISYKNDPRNPLSLRENDINDILEDQAGNIWIGTWGGGLDCLEPTRKIFKHIDTPADDGASLEGTRILCQMQDARGRIWIGTWSSGLFTLEPDSFEIHHIALPAPPSGDLDQPHVWNIGQDVSGKIWLGLQYGLYRERSPDEFESALATKTWVRALVPAPAGGVYCSTDDGIFKATPLDGEIEITQLANEPSMTFTEIFLDHRGILWAGTRRNGLIRINPETGELRIERHSDSDPHSLAFDNIRSIMEDRSQNLWIGTRGGGADCLDLKAAKFRGLARRDFGLPSDSIWAFLIDHAGDLWIGTDDGLCRLSQDTGIPQIFQPNGRNSVSHEKIRALAEDGFGNIWIGTKGGGLDRLASDRKNFRHYQHSQDDPQSISSNSITGLIIGPSGRIWIGTDDAGLDEFAPSEGSFHHHPVHPEVPGGNRISALKIHGSETLWIGTDGGGFSILDLQNGQLSHLGNSELSNGHIHAFAENGNGQIYVGTHGGLNILNADLKLVDVLSEEDGLPDNTIYGIIATGPDKLWLTTNQGLARYTPSSGKIRCYGVDDGLVSMGFNEGAAYLGPQGSVFIGGARGFNTFHPGSVQDNPFPPKIVLTEMATITEEGRHHTLPESTGEIDVPFSNNTLIFRWIGLEFTDPASIKYTYRLKDFESEWVEAGKTRERRYTNLSPGTYVFQVRAANNDGLWSEAVHGTPIRIRRPYWQHPLFLLAAFSVLSLILLLLHQGLSHSIRRQNQDLEEQMKLRSIAEEKATRYAGELEHATLFDTLTGLPNRALITDRIRVLLARCQRHPLSTFAILVLDLDGFRLINDSLGHRLGDELLSQLAARFQEIIRTDDTLGRLGGDEFVVILHSDASATSLEEFCERVHQSLKMPFLLEGREVFSTACLGSVLGCANYDGPEELLRDADTAMYRAKKLGRARHVLFDPGMHLEASNILQLENDLRRGIEKKEFLLHYQPIINLQQDRLSAFEALVRWKSPGQPKVVAPKDFLETIRNAGLARDLGSWVLEECCAQASIWRSKGYTEIGIAANLFIQQVLDPELPAQILRLLQAVSCPPSMLHLEITEEVLIDAPESAIRVLAALQQAGIEVHLDDFGSGFSSLSYLQRFPVDIVKIDQSFVTSMLEDLNATKIVEAVILLSHGLGKRTIAEGIESGDVAHRLKELGCDFGQGYYFSKPMSAEDAERLLGLSPPDWLGLPKG